ncbi:MAG: DUF4494 domain-containing protein [Bacteroidota bacterium]|jgi:hypothetical protein|nr:DUF4494 domain-containing protein [Bacteroidota bacterium]MDP3434903.1 DUF4494 domain-containing protein [Bacteroidota bacterium]
MQTWFECKVKYVKIDDDGRERKVSEVYLVDAVSFTDAETRIIQQMETMVRGEFMVDNIKKSNIVEIYPHENGEWWYKARIGIVTIDEKAGKEKKINNYFLVAADDLKQALQRLEEGLAYVLVPYQTTSLAICNIVDVFPYFEDKVNAKIPSNLKPLKEVTKTPVFEDEDLDVVYSADDEEDEETELEETDDQE